MIAIEIARPGAAVRGSAGVTSESPLTPMQVADIVRCGSPLEDHDFDAVYSTRLRTLSRVHWTPLAVARRALEWLAPGPSDTVLDIGSGVGKFCLIGAITTGAQFCGVECRAELVAAADRAARLVAAGPRAQFVHADAVTADWSQCAGLYMYNPFGEMLMPADDHSLDVISALGPRVRSERRHAHDRQVALAEAKLRSVRAGTRIVTFHGFGGDMPIGIDLVERETIATGPLELWIRT
jgi:predicted RNA methylase